MSLSTGPGYQLHRADALEAYEDWTDPVLIISDGPYGLGSFPGEVAEVGRLVDVYEPHVKVWSSSARPDTTLWFWCSEEGWATVHPLLVSHGWVYRNCHVWDKGKSHTAGNANTKTLRKLPVVTEVCVQYVRDNTLPLGLGGNPVAGYAPGQQLRLKDWLRAEWLRAGLALQQANEACGVKSAATRKYLAQDRMWYFPPGEMLRALAEYADQHGDPSGRPYFGGMTEQQWEGMRAKFNCPFGWDNVWRLPAVRGKERIKSSSGKALHMNQKPLELMELIVSCSSDPQDVVWEPFAGTATASLAAARSGRVAYAAEINQSFFDLAANRLRQELE